MSIYTKTGDKGYTSLIGGERVEKFDPRVEAYGCVDELISFTALLADKLMGDEKFSPYEAQLRQIECHLMTISALLAVGKDGKDKVAALKCNATEELEKHIDAMQEQLPAITKFTIPGGDERISLCHVCRTICRRTERAAICAGASFEVDCDATIYLNRLSDYFYLLGRTLTRLTATKEIEWRP